MLYAGLKKKMPLGALGTNLLALAQAMGSGVEAWVSGLFELALL